MDYGLSGKFFTMVSILRKVGFATAAVFVTAALAQSRRGPTAVIESGGKTLRTNAIHLCFIDGRCLAGLTALNPLKRLGHLKEHPSLPLFQASDQLDFNNAHYRLIDDGYTVR